MDLSVYLNELNAVKKEIRLDNDSYLDVQLKYLGNYLDQMACVKSLELFEAENEASEDKDEKDKEADIYMANKSNILIEKKELKVKLLYKLNILLNEKFEEIQKIFTSIESRLTQMAHQYQLVQDEKDNAEATTSKTDENNNQNEIDFYKLGLSMLKINKTFWTNYYDLKEEFTLENLQKSNNTSAIKNVLNKWYQNDLAHLQVDLELCRHYAAVSAAKKGSTGRKLAAV